MVIRDFGVTLFIIISIAMIIAALSVSYGVPCDPMVQKCIEEAK